MTAPAAVLVTRWRDLPGARKGDGWIACHQARTLSPARETEHATAEEALRAVLRSGFARTLGARAASRVTWTARAAARGGAR